MRLLEGGNRWPHARSVAVGANRSYDSNAKAHPMLLRVKSWLRLMGKAEPTRSSGRRMGAGSRRRESVTLCSVCRRVCRRSIIRFERQISPDAATHEVLVKTHGQGRINPLIGTTGGAASRRRKLVAQCSVCRRWPPIDHMIRAPKPPDAATR